MDKIFILSILLIVVLATFSFGNQLTSKEEFIGKIDYYLFSEPDLDLGSQYSDVEKEIIHELFRSALKRIKDRVLNIQSYSQQLDGFEPLEFDPPTYNQTVIDAFASKTLLNPPQNLTYNPYDDPNFNTTNPDSVCAVYYPNPYDRSGYELLNFSSPAEAEAAGAFVTHLHPCGLCSTTKDLAMYMYHMDLTSPIRDCAIVTFVSDKLSLDCIQHSAGLTYDCSVIWLYDALNTRKDCLDICLYDWISHVPNNTPPNSTILNPCLQCDEDKSGPIFKIVAARTRRDSGLKSAINRPPDSIYNITHYYY